MTKKAEGKVVSSLDVLIASMLICCQPVWSPCATLLIMHLVIVPVRSGLAARMIGVKLPKRPTRGSLLNLVCLPRSSSSRPVLQSARASSPICPAELSSGGWYVISSCCIHIPSHFGLISSAFRSKKEPKGQKRAKKRMRESNPCQKRISVQTSVDVSHVVTHHSTKSPQLRLTSQFGMGYGAFGVV